MAENNPRVLFERMFGSSDSTDARVRAARLKQDRSLLDSVNDRVGQLQRKLGTADNRKVNDYLAALRDVETADSEGRGAELQGITGRAPARRHPG